MDKLSAKIPRFPRRGIPTDEADAPIRFRSSKTVITDLINEETGEPAIPIGSDPQTEVRRSENRQQGNLGFNSYNEFAKSGLTQMYSSDPEAIIPSARDENGRVDPGLTKSGLVVCHRCKQNVSPSRVTPKKQRNGEYHKVCRSGCEEW